MSDPSGRIALDITASANVAEVAKARSEVSALGDAAKKSADLTRQAWQEAGGDLTKMGQIYQRLTMSVEQTSTAVAEQTTVVKESTVAWEGFSGGTRRMQSAFVSMAFAGEAFTRSMDAGDGALRRVFRSLSMLGFLGGPELGVATTAIASIGDGLVDMWARSEKAAKSAQVQFEKTLETLSRGTLEGAAREQQYLYSGDPFARRGAHPEMSDAQFLALSGGRTSLEARASQLAAQVAQQRALALSEASAAGSLGVGAPGGQGAASRRLADLSAKLDEINKLLATQKERIAEITPVTQRLAAIEGERAGFRLQQLREAAARRETQRLRPEEVPLTIGNLAEQERAFGITGRSEAAALGVRGFSSIDLTQQRASAAQRVTTASQSGGLAFRIEPAKLIETQFHLMQVEAAKSSEEFQKYLTQRVGSTMADGLVAGIRAGFSGSGIKGAFAAGSRAILAGFGGMLIDEGKVYLEKAAIMEALVPHLFNPVTSGWAAAGIGAALIGLGASLEGLATRSGGGGGGAGAAANGNTFAPSNIGGGGGTTVNIYTTNPNTREAALVAAYYINRGQILNTPIPPPYGAPS